MMNLDAEHVRLHVQAKRILDSLPEGLSLTDSERNTLEYLVKDRVVWGNRRHEDFLKKLNARIALYSAIDSHGMRRGDFIEYFSQAGHDDMVELLKKRG